MEKKGGGTRGEGNKESAEADLTGSTIRVKMHQNSADDCVCVHLTGMCKTKTIQHQCVFRDELLLKIFSQPCTSLTVCPEPFPPTYDAS